MRALLAVTALVLVTAACSPTGLHGTPPPGAVHGHVLAAPCSPVERLDSPCAGLPVAGATLTFTRGSAQYIATTVSDGSYSIALPPGDWSVSLNAHRLPATTVTSSVSVGSGTSTSLDFHVDSGIR